MRMCGIVGRYISVEIFLEILWFKFFGFKSLIIPTYANNFYKVYT